MNRPPDTEAKLLPIRRAIHGWEFAGKSGLRSRLQNAEIELKNLPAEYHEAANELMEPLRGAIEGIPL